MSPSPFTSTLLKRLSVTEYDAVDTMDLGVAQHPSFELLTLVTVSVVATPEGTPCGTTGMVAVVAPLQPSLLAVMPDNGKEPLAAVAKATAAAGTAAEPPE